MSKNRLWIFDLDHTVIDSSHRQLTSEKGDLNLAHWRENCTPEKIALDTLLPLADNMRDAYSAGHKVAICTSRVMQKADWDFLKHNNLLFHYAQHRAIDDTRSDGIYKRDKLQRILSHFLCPPNRAILFDDNEDVLDVARSMGILAIDAKLSNDLSHEVKRGTL